MFQILKQKNKILLGLFLTAVYFLTRLSNLLSIPIFTDEAIYLRWSQIMAYDPALRYLPLVDGKPPLFMWLVMVGMRLLPSVDPLFIGRLTSVICGFFVLAAVVFASYIFFKNKKIALFAGLLYIFSPFAFFYDRMTLAESLLSAFCIWSLALGFLLVKKLRLDIALLLGWVVGLGLLTKTPAIFFLLVQPLIFFGTISKKDNFIKTTVKWLVLMAVVLIESQAIFSILRLFPLFSQIGAKNSSFIISFSEFSKNPLGLFWGNLPSLVSWEFWYLTPSVSILLIIGLVVAVYKKNFLVIALFLSFLAEFCAMLFFNRVLFVRYLFTFTPALLIVSAYGLAQVTEKTKNKFVTILLVLIVLSFPSFTIFKLITDPINAPTPISDSQQYLHAWPAGWGVVEVRDFLTMESKKFPKITLVTEGTFGLMPYALEIYQKDYPNVDIKAVWPLSEVISPEFETLVATQPVYLLMYQRQTVPIGWKLTELMRFKQGHGTDYLRLYKVN